MRELNFIWIRAWFAMFEIDRKTKRSRAHQQALIDHVTLRHLSRST